MPRPSHLKQSPLKTHYIRRETDKHIVKVFSLYRVARSDLKATIYKANAGVTCLARKLRNVLSAAAVPADHSTRSYLKFWPPELFLSIGVKGHILLLLLRYRSFGLFNCTGFCWDYLLHNSLFGAVFWIWDQASADNTGML